MHEDKAQEPTVRPLQTGDAEAVAALSNELGYACQAAEMQSRIARLLNSAGRVAFAAILDDKLAGWIDAAVEYHLQSPDTVVIGGLVVEQNLRGRGIGRLLCQAVEAWAREQGASAVRVRSQTKREDAHRFYQREGFERIKTSAVFEKTLR